MQGLYSVCITTYIHQICKSINNVVPTVFTGGEPGYYGKRVEAGNRTVRPAFLTSAPSHFDSSSKSLACVSENNIHENTGAKK